MLYIFILFILFLLAYAEGFCAKTSLGIYAKKTIIQVTIVMSFLLACIAAFRGNIGYDHNNYMSIFDYSIYDQKIEKGYLLLNRFFKVTTNSYYLFQIFSSFFSSFVIALYIFKNSRYPAFFYFVYFACLIYTNFDLNQQRQHLAVAIVLLGIIRSNYFRRKKIFFLYTLIACYFHVASICCFILPIFSIFFSFKIIYAMFFFIVFLMITKGGIILNFLQFFSAFAPGRWYYLVNGYIDFYKTHNARNFSVLGFLLRVFVFLFIIYINYDDLKKKNVDTNNINLKFKINSLMMVLLLTSFSSFFEMFGRFNEYYNLAGAFLAYETILDSKKVKTLCKHIPTLRFIIILLYFLFFLLIFYNSWKIPEYRAVFSPFDFFF